MPMKKGNMIAAWKGGGCALLSALFLIASFPPLSLSWLAWIALVPLILYARKTAFLSRMLSGWLFGVATVWGICFWIFQVPGFHWYHALPFALYIGIYPALWTAGLSILDKKHRLIIFFAPTLWISLDYLKNHAGFLTFPWATLDLTQARHPAFIQIAAVTGGYGITFFIILINIAFAEIILTRRPKIIVFPLLLMIVLVCCGYKATSHHDVSPALQVAAVQPAILLRERKTNFGRAAYRQRLETLTREAIAAGAKLIVWPETALQNFSHHPELQAWVQKIARQAQVSIVTGASEFIKFHRDKEVDPHAPPYKLYNSAFFIDQKGTILTPYHKNILVPFGEYIPARTMIRWPVWLVPDFTEGLAGKNPAYFSVTRQFQISPIICWENLFPDFVRHIVTGGADLLVHISNDNWFGPTAAPEQHNLASSIRAVENGVPIILSSNTGPSEIIDSHGLVLAKSGKFFAPGLVMATLYSGHTHTTFYTQYGDLFAWFCVLLVFYRLLSTRLHYVKKIPQKK